MAGRRGGPERLVLPPGAAEPRDSGGAADAEGAEGGVDGAGVRALAELLGEVVPAAAAAAAAVVGAVDSDGAAEATVARTAGSAAEGAPPCSAVPVALPPGAGKPSAEAGDPLVATGASLARAGAGAVAERAAPLVTADSLRSSTSTRANNPSGLVSAAGMSNRATKISSCRRGDVLPLT